MGRGKGVGIRSMNITIKKLKLENFKGIHNLSVDFNQITKIVGANATGKTTLVDGVSFLLFGKDSQGNEKFELRPLDSDGNKIHHLIISVEGTFNVDGSDITLKKSVSERWTKKRGSLSEELQGNETLYEINGFPKKESEYKAYINGLVDEQMFKMLTNPMFFPSLPWKEQREILMQFVSNLSDYELATEAGVYEPILEDLSRGTTDELAAKYRKEQSGLKKEQQELPVRIDEVSRGKVKVDEQQLSKEKMALQHEVEEVNFYLMNADVSTKVRTISKEIMDMETQRNRMLNDTRESYESKRNELRMALIRAQSEQKMYEQKLDSYSREISRLDSEIVEQGKNKQALQKLWKEEKGREYDGSSECPFCHQELPQNMLDEAVSKFEKEKVTKLRSIEGKGQAVVEELNRLKANLSLNEQNKKIAYAQLEEVKKEIESTNDALNQLVEPTIPDEIHEFEKQIEAKKEEIKALNSADDTDKYAVARESLENRIKEIDRELDGIVRNAEIDARVAELMKEQREIAQRAAEVEQKINCLEEFTRYKMALISSEVNGLFNGVKFNLFTVQINQGIKETCELTINGVPYGSLNSGHRIIAGLAIIRGLQKKFDIVCPVFVDNAESLSSFNLPKMDCQMVTLSVSDENGLTIK